MKKIISLFLGCLAALVIAVSFSACNNKNNNNASIDDAALLGSWYWDNQSMKFTLIVEADHTGSITVKGSYLPSVMKSEFAWSIEGNIVHLSNVSGQVPGLEELGDSFDLMASFNAQGQLLFTLVSDPSISFGPFTKQ